MKHTHTLTRTPRESRLQNIEYRVVCFYFVFNFVGSSKKIQDEEELNGKNDGKKWGMNDNEYTKHLLSHAIVFFSSLSSPMHFYRTPT